MLKREAFRRIAGHAFLDALRHAAQHLNSLDAVFPLCFCLSNHRFSNASGLTIDPSQSPKVSGMMWLPCHRPQLVIGGVLLDLLRPPSNAKNRVLWPSVSTKMCAVYIYKKRWLVTLSPPGGGSDPPKHLFFSGQSNAHFVPWRILLMQKSFTLGKIEKELKIFALAFQFWFEKHPLRSGWAGFGWVKCGSISSGFSLLHLQANNSFRRQWTLNDWTKMDVEGWPGLMRALRFERQRRVGSLRAILGSTWPVVAGDWPLEGGYQPLAKVRLQARRPLKWRPMEGRRSQQKMRVCI